MSVAGKVGLILYVLAGISVASVTRLERTRFCPQANGVPARMLFDAISWPISGLVTSVLLATDAPLKSCVDVTAAKGN